MKSATDKLSKITIGKIGAPHGVRGDVKVYPLTDFPDRFDELEHAFIDEKPVEIVFKRWQKNFLVMKFRGIDSRESAARLTNHLLKVDRRDVPPLGEGEYYAFDIIGLEVRDQDDTVLGKITNILKTGSNDVYVTKTADGRELMVPALKKVVTEINVAGGYIKVIWDGSFEF